MLYEVITDYTLTCLQTLLDDLITLVARPGLDYAHGNLIVGVDHRDRNNFV